MDTNNTDKRFRDKLGDYAREPDPQVWERIETSLNAKKRRRILPVWWYLGGAAAVLLLGLLLLNPFGDSDLETPSVTDTEIRTPDASDRDNSNAVQQENAIPGSEDPGLPPEDALTGSPAGRGQGELPGGDQSDSSGRPGGPTGASQVPPPAATNTVAATTTGNAQTDSRSESERVGRQAPDPDRNALAVSESPEKTEIDRQTAAGNPDSRDPAVVDPARTNRQDPSNLQTDTRIAAVETEQEGAAAVQPEDGNKDKISIFDAIEEAEKEAVAETAQNRWAVGPSIAPVYFNSFGNGSPISPNFVANSKSGTMNLSYGLTVAYEVSKKLSVRSGIHKVDFGYNTNEVAFSPNFSAVPASLIQTISYSENSKNVVVQSTADNRSPDVNPVANEVSAPSLQREGRMTQQFGYLEVPLEMQYNLVDRKWGLNVIGGVSSLFLVDNSISLDAEGAVTEIGEATNMNEVSFSTNVGLGVFYKLNSNLHVQVQPMFKYHMNTFSQTNGNFQPYSVGVYSGVQLRF